MRASVILLLFAVFGAAVANELALEVFNITCSTEFVLRNCSNVQCPQKTVLKCDNATQYPGRKVCQCDVPDCNATLVGCSPTCGAYRNATTGECQCRRACDTVGDCQAALPVVSLPLDPTNNNRRGVPDSCFPPANNPCVTAQCVSNTRCALVFNDQGVCPSPKCEGGISRCFLGKCRERCPFNQTVVLPPPQKLPPSCDVSCGADSSATAVCDADAPLMFNTTDNTCSGTCRCKLPPTTRPPVCNATTFPLCAQSLPDCRSEAENGAGIASDADSCCGSCRTLPVCPLPLQVRCILNQRPCFFNGTLREQPRRIPGSCCASCRPHPLRPLPKTNCTPACGDNQVCVPVPARNGDLGDNFCRNVLRRDFWVPRVNRTQFDDETATSFWRILLRRAHQAAGRKWIRFLFWWRVSFARVMTGANCQAGPRPSNFTAEADCVAFYMVDPRPIGANAAAPRLDMFSKSTSQKRSDTQCTAANPCPTDAELASLFDDVVARTQTTVGAQFVGATPTMGATLSFSVAILSAMLLLAMIL